MPPDMPTPRTQGLSDATMSSTLLSTVDTYTTGQLAYVRQRLPAVVQPGNRVMRADLKRGPQAGRQA